MGKARRWAWPVKTWILLVCVAHGSRGTATASSAIQQIKLIAYLSRRHIEQRTSDIERQQINRAPWPDPPTVALPSADIFIRLHHHRLCPGFSLLTYDKFFVQRQDRCLIIVCNKKKRRAQANRSSRSHRCDNWPKRFPLERISRFLASQLANHGQPMTKMENRQATVSWRVAERSSSSAPSAHHRSTYARGHRDTPTESSTDPFVGRIFRLCTRRIKFKVDRTRTLARLGRRPTATDSTRPPEVRIAAEPAANKRGRIIDPLEPHVPRCNSLAFSVDLTCAAPLCQN
jgi:hypothetical protein